LDVQRVAPIYKEGDSLAPGVSPSRAD
jgi:hypothetical protein